MRKEVALLVLLRICHDERHRLARGIQLRFRHHVGVAHDIVRSLPIRRDFFGLELVGIRVARSGIELPAWRAGRMRRAVAESHHGKHQQRRDLNHVNRDAHRRRAGNAAMCNVCDGEGEHDRNEHHEHRSRIGCAHEVRPKCTDYIAADDARHADHHTGVYPVIKMRAPADNELRKTRILPRGFVIEKRLFSEIVGTAGAGIQFRHLRVTDGGRQTEQQRENDADPHGRRGCTFSGLRCERQPEERTGRNQRHGVHREARQAQGCFHFRSLVCHKLSLIWTPSLFGFRATSRDKRGPVLLYSQR